MSLQPKLTRRPPSFTRPVGPTDRPTLFFLSLSLSLSLSHFGRILFSAPQPSKDTDLTYRAFITSVDDDDRSRLRLEAEQKNVLSLSSVAAKRWPLYFLLLFFLSFFSCPVSFFSLLTPFCLLMEGTNCHGRGGGRSPASTHPTFFHSLIVPVSASIFHYPGTVGR